LTRVIIYARNTVVYGQTILRHHESLADRRLTGRSAHPSRRTRRPAPPCRFRRGLCRLRSTPRWQKHADAGGNCECRLKSAAGGPRSAPPPIRGARVRRSPPRHSRKLILIDRRVSQSGKPCRHRGPKSTPLAKEANTACPTVPVCTSFRGRQNRLRPTAWFARTAACPCRINQ